MEDRAPMVEGADMEDALEVAVVLLLLLLLLLLLFEMSLARFSAERVLLIFRFSIPAAT